MINFYNQVPTIYTSASRDFQYMSWLINIVLNSVKHNVDDMYNLPDIGGDPKLTELLALTLGFKVKRNYDKKQLAALVSVLPYLLKYKGTTQAIMTAAEALITATGSLGTTDVDIKGTEVEVTLPNDLTDITLFLDILDYILPAGMTCHIKRKTETRYDIDPIKLRHKDVLKLVVADDLAWEQNNTRSTGLSSLYDLENASIVLGKAATGGTTGDGLTSVNVIAKASVISMTRPSMWHFKRTNYGIKVQSCMGSDKYLAHYIKHDEDNQPVPYVKLVSENEATEWQIEFNNNSAWLSTVSNGVRYLLAYTSRQQFCTCPENKKGSNIVDLHLYKKASKSGDRDPVYTFETITTDFSDTDDLLIVAQGNPEFNASIKSFGDNFVLNVGLLNITVIPTLSGGLLITPDDTVALYALNKDQHGNPYTLVDESGMQLRAKKPSIQEL